MRIFLLVIGVFFVGIAVLGSRDRPVVYDSYKRVSPTSITYPVPDLQVTGLPSFVGAEGHGSEVLTWCRETLPLKVTLINDSTDLWNWGESIVSDNFYDIGILTDGGDWGMPNGWGPTDEGCAYLPGQTARGDGLNIRGSQGPYADDATCPYWTQPAPVTDPGFYWCNPPERGILDMRADQQDPDGRWVLRYLYIRAANCQDKQIPSTGQYMCSFDNSGPGSGSLAAGRNGVDGWILDHNSWYPTTDETHTTWVSSFCNNDPQSPEYCPDPFTNIDLDASDTIRNQTVSWNMYNTGTAWRSTGPMAAGTGSVSGQRWNIKQTWHHNFFTGLGGRVPAGSGGSADDNNLQGQQTINNVVWEGYAHINRPNHSATNDFIGNVYMKNGWPDPIANCHNNVSVRISGLSFGDPNVGDGSNYSPYWNSASFYLSDNLQLRSCQQWNTNQNQMIRWEEGFAAFENDCPTCFRTTPMAFHPRYPVTIEPSSTVQASVIADAGNNKRLECDGTWTIRRDSIDTRNVQLVTTNTYSADPKPNAPPLYNQPGSTNTLVGGSPCTDGDGDGMPNAYENLYANISSGTPDANSDVDGDGWLAIEEYLNLCDSGVSCSPDVFTDAYGVEAASPPPVPTFQNNRWVYQDTLVLDTVISGASVTTFVRPDTVLFPYTGVPYAVVLKDVLTAAEGDTILILSDDSVVGAVPIQLDTLQVDSLVLDWAPRCDERGICTDSLRNRSVP